MSIKESLTPLLTSVDKPRVSTVTFMISCAKATASFFVAAKVGTPIETIAKSINTIWSILNLWDIIIIALKFPTHLMFKRVELIFH